MRGRPRTAFGGGAVGTGAGTATGIGVGAAFGDDLTWNSAGLAFASAAVGAISSTALSAGWQEVTEGNTGGRAALDSRGLPRYDDGKGGASSTGLGGSEGASAGPNTAFDPGILLQDNGDGTYRPSRVFMECVGNEFRKVFGFDPSVVRVKFGWAYGSPAFTYKNTITIDPSKGWSGWDNVGQEELLVQELTHSAQFAQGGAATVMTRRALEDAQFWKDAYEPSSELSRIADLRTLDVLDPRFTIESIAKHVERTMSPDSNTAYIMRRR